MREIGVVVVEHGRGRLLAAAQVAQARVPTRIAVKVAAQPSPVGDWARKPTAGSPSSAKWRTNVPALAVAGRVQREGDAHAGDAQPHVVAVDQRRVAVVRQSARHDADDHRRRPAASARTRASPTRARRPHRISAAGVERRAQVRRDARARAASRPPAGRRSGAMPRAAARRPADRGQVGLGAGLDGRSRPPRARRRARVPAQVERQRLHASATATHVRAGSVSVPSGAMWRATRSASAAEPPGASRRPGASTRSWKLVEVSQAVSHHCSTPPGSASRTPRRPPRLGEARRPSSVSAITPSARPARTARARPGSGGSTQAALDSSRPRPRRHRFSSGAGPGGERDAPAGPQHAARLAQRGLGVGHQHVAPAAQHAVELAAGEVDRLRVDLQEARRWRSRAPRPARWAASSISGAKSERDQRPAAAGSARRRAARCRRCRRPARARLAGLRVDRVDHPGRHRHRRAAQRVRLRGPARGRRAPALAVSCGSSAGIHRSALASSARRSLPDAVRGSCADQLDRLGHLEAAPAARGSGRAARGVGGAPSRGTTAR